MRLIILLVCLSLLGGAVPAQAFLKRPKLILVLVIDQFRADYLFRFEKRFLPAGSGAQVGGMRYLMAKGAYFPYGEYGLLQNMTGPGHSTILSGSYPYTNGIALNTWYDSRNGRTYCTEDPAQPIVGGETLPHLGTSPKNFQATTVGDELKNAGYPARVVSIALKDRAAILLGGHRADLALWLDMDTVKWVSSKFYLPSGELPGWIKTLDEKTGRWKGRTYRWELPGPGTGFTEESSKFPHLDKIGGPDSFSNPLGTELTEEAAEAAVDAYDLGRGKATDLLALSFSPHDFVGHEYGPNSREIEEMTVSEDRQIAKLLNYLRTRLGSLDEVTMVLTADHGAPLSPEYARAHGIDAGRINTGKLATDLSEHLDAKFGRPSHDPWIVFTNDFNFYLNAAAIAEKKLVRAAVEAEAKTFVLAVPGVAYVVTGTDYAARVFPPLLFEKQLLRQYVPGRSGDLLVIPKPFWMRDEDAVDHITGYAYDRTVPIVLAGFGVKRGLHADHAEVIDIAPTLSFIAGAMPPSLSEGRILREALAPEEIR